MFWQVCFRFAQTFPKLEKLGLHAWAEKLEAGLRLASKSGKTLHDLPPFGRKMEKAVLGNEEARKELSQRGAVFGIIRVVENCGSGARLTMEFEPGCDDAEMLGDDLVTVMEGAMRRRTENFLDEMKKAGIKVDYRVVIDSLAEAPELNEQHGIITGLDAASLLLEVDLDNGVTRKFRLENLVREEAFLAGNVRPRLEGTLSAKLRLCAGCGCREKALGVYKSCKACRAVHYCSRTCQVSDWKRAGGHKTTCGKGPSTPAAASRDQPAAVNSNLLAAVNSNLLAAAVNTARPQADSTELSAFMNRAVQIVVLPPDGEPYSMTLRPGTFEDQMLEIAVDILGGTEMYDMGHIEIKRHGYALTGVRVYFNAEATQNGIGKGNPAATALTVGMHQLLDIDEQGEIKTDIRGNALLVKIDWEECGGGYMRQVEPERLADFSLEAYMKWGGSFKTAPVPRGDGTWGMLTSFFPKTPAGEKDQETFMRGFLGLRGLPYPLQLGTQV